MADDGGEKDVVKEKEQGGGAAASLFSDEQWSAIRSLIQQTKSSTAPDPPQVAGQEVQGGEKRISESGVRLILAGFTRPN